MEDFIPGHVATVNMGYDIQEGYHKSRVVKPVIVSRRPDVNHMVVFNTTCTHLGCILFWNEQRQIIACPCHEAYFNTNGAVVSGPPPSPLATYRVRVDGDQIYVEGVEG